MNKYAATALSHLVSCRAEWVVWHPRKMTNSPIWDLSANSKIMAMHPCQTIGTMVMTHFTPIFIISEICEPCFVKK